ncbi:MAG: hypothetical protein AB7W16_24560 [Candidatus Obscuribacterales bacterium]
MKRTLLHHLIPVASSLALLTAGIYISPVCGAPPAAKTKSTDALPSPEAGVKLLIGILERIGGNAPLIAMQQSVNAPKEFQQTNQIFQNATDPALNIRPKLKKSAGGYVNHKVAMIRPSSSPAVVSESDSFKRLSESAGRLYGITDAMDKMQSAAGAGAAGNLAAEPAPTSGVVNIGSSSSPRGTLLSRAGKVMDYRESATPPAVPADASGLVPPPPPVGWQSKDSDEEALMRSAAKPEKLDQPAYLKHIRETKRRALPSEPPSGSKLIASNERARLSYIPPSLVAGIPGLRLGASERNVSSFFTSQKNVDKVRVGDWQVWSLKHATSGHTLLQVYLRNGTAEAFRIFDGQYVPGRLGISLSSDLKAMKKQFGEPAFILNEPTGAGGKVSGVKNYVYPVSQVSFQLARSGKDNAPRIKSMLLFKFL